MRWRIVVELTYDPLAPDETASAALDRAKDKLNSILDKTPFVHFHVLKQPELVAD